MAKKLRIVLAQLNLFVGDIQGNLLKMIAAANKARDTLKANIIVFPELSLTGYPPEDLLLRPSFLQEAHLALQQFKKEVRDIYCVVGHPHATSQGLFNSCSLIYNDTILGRYAKQHLPNYGVFDEYRYFTPGNSPCVIPVEGIPIGVVICEDLWFSPPIQQAANLGARIILSPNASPFELDKHEQRHFTLAKRAKSVNLPIIYVNNVGGQDDIVFDGGSMVVDASGKICAQAGFFNETLLPVDFEVTSTETLIQEIPFELPNEEKRVYDALVLGVRDYVKKNGFKGALIGVSGGIDSALTLAIAVDALQKENVTAVYMPSRYSADISLEDAQAVSRALGVEEKIISIENVFPQFMETLSPYLSTKPGDMTEQNLQSRCRGMILMALSNNTGNIVLTTGNRSEMATGYATLYGDMAGGFCVLKDVPKLMVYRLAKYRNQLSPVIPERTLLRAPTAELAPNQTDEDTLPPYSTLDKILELYLNQAQSIEEIIAQGFDRDTVVKTVSMIKKNEYKRRQAPIGPRINHTAFGKDRRYPVSAGFKG